MAFRLLHRTHGLMPSITALTTQHSLTNGGAPITMFGTMLQLQCPMNSHTAESPLGSMLSRLIGEWTGDSRPELVSRSRSTERVHLIPRPSDSPMAVST